MEESKIDRTQILAQNNNKLSQGFNTEEFAREQYIEVGLLFLFDVELSRYRLLCCCELAIKEINLENVFWKEEKSKFHAEFQSMS